MRTSWLILLVAIGLGLLAVAARWFATAIARRRTGFGAASCPSCGHALPGPGAPRCPACGESV